MRRKRRSAADRQANRHMNLPYFPTTQYTPRQEESPAAATTTTHLHGCHDELRSESLRLALEKQRVPAFPEEHLQRLCFCRLAEVEESLGGGVRRRAGGVMEHHARQRERAGEG